MCQGKRRFAFFLYLDICGRTFSLSLAEKFVLLYRRRAERQLLLWRLQSGLGLESAGKKKRKNQISTVAIINITSLDHPGVEMFHSLTEAQLRTLMNAYANLGLPADVLIDLLTYLHREKQTVTRRDIEEQAYLWADMGIFTAEAAAEFLSRREAEKPLLQEMMRALDLAGRDPAPDEYRYLSGFIRQGFDAEAVQLAKERMYARLGKFSWKYLAGIMESWHAKGLHTAAEITAVEPQLRQPKPASASTAAAAPKPPVKQDGNLADWERDWLEEFHAMTRKEGNGNGI